MELRQVETFRAVAEELSFSRAAAKLGYVQSSVSAQVAALEQDLGAPLFDRLGRRIALTEAGAVMLSHSRKLLALADDSYAPCPQPSPRPRRRQVQDLAVRVRRNAAADRTQIPLVRQANADVGAAPAARIVLERRRRLR